MIGAMTTGCDERGWIFNIQKFSLHDGSGIRTLVFMKGCPLACTWCSNPEGQACRPQVLYARAQCIGTDQCDRCVAACKAAAIVRNDDGRIAIDRGRCDACGDCTRVCPSRALALSGSLVGVDEVIAAVEQDSGFYVRSGGGMTVSGGEPLAQDRFVEALLTRARSRGLDTAIETSGFGRWEALQRVAPHADQIFFDIKCIDHEKHRAATGVSNEIILDNFRKLRREFPATAVVVRTPIVAGFNDSSEDIESIARFIDQAGGAGAYELLAYHGFGEPKYHRLGRNYPLVRIEAPSQETMATLREVAARCAGSSCNGGSIAGRP